ncbi:hypothetical protein V8J82_01525 [Gymnodinialimonas sp. 2305UL16-5]|uniref:hypothetical protein n=1 Tax=Gymnodinialimonas mytili TaxID=3126503 RepID=UPI0030958A4C
MTRFVMTLVAILIPSVALAHGAEGVPHIHPHGTEALLAALVVLALIILWRMRRS